jgi:hypothetical protein
VARVHYFREWMASALPDGPLKDEVARLPGTRALLVAGKCPRLVHPIDLRNTDRKIVVRIGVDRPADGGAPPPYERHPEPRHEIAPLSRAGGVLATDPGLLVASRLVADGARCRRRSAGLGLGRVSEPSDQAEPRTGVAFLRDEWIGWGRSSCRVRSCTVADPRLCRRRWP